MDAIAAKEYYEAIPVLLGRQRLNDITVSVYSELTKPNKQKALSQYQKMANPSFSVKRKTLDEALGISEGTDGK